MDKDKIHVIPVAPNDWEIEEQTGDAVTRESDKATALAVALEVAREKGVESVIVHDGSGVTEEVHVADLPEPTPGLEIPSPS